MRIGLIHGTTGDTSPTTGLAADSEASEGEASATSDEDLPPTTVGFPSSSRGDADGCACNGGGGTGLWAFGLLALARRRRR